MRPPSSGRPARSSRGSGSSPERRTRFGSFTAFLPSGAHVIVVDGIGGDFALTRHPRRRGYGRTTEDAFVAWRGSYATLRGGAVEPIPWYDGGMTAAKIAVTVPRETLLAVEKRRRVLGVTRSAVVTAALEAWLTEQTMTAEERRYLLAYLRQPESVEELRDARAVAKAVASSWESWDAAPPRARRRRRSTDASR